MSFLQNAFTQQRSATPVDGISRSPFVPVRKHKSSTSPPSSPVSRSTRSAAPTPSRQHSSASVASSSSALLPTTAHNVLPSVAVYPSSPPEFRTPAVPRKVISSHQQQPQQPHSSSSPALFTAPKVRAKLTPAATPRRKGYLPGTEFADVPVRRGGVEGSPIKCAPPPLALTPSTPAARPLAPASTYGSFPSYYENGAEQYGVEAMSRNLAGMGLGQPSRVERSTKGRDNVLVCVR